MKTNIATTKSQSERLLKCGVHAESADMCWFRGWGNVGDYDLNVKPYSMMVRINEESCRGRNEIAPAWSLRRLFALLPHKIYDEYEDDSFYFSLAKDTPRSEIYCAAYIHYSDHHFALISKHDECPVEACVQLIEWLTANGYKLNGIEKGGEDD